MAAAGGIVDNTPTQADLSQNRRDELGKLSKDELIDLVMEMETTADDTIPVHRRPTGSRPFDMPWEPREYVRLPENSDAAHHLETGESRRVSLISFDLAHPIIGIELCGNVIIGRGTESDLDLTEYSAFDYGVSRRHAMLRVIDGQFQLVDLNSTNGTSCNDARLKPEVPHRLQHDDVLDFGKLKFQFRVID